MKLSTDWVLTPAQRYQDRKRAERALGRQTSYPECVHHHSMTQLVICQDTQYHALLHQRHYEYRLNNDPKFIEILISREEAKEAKFARERDALRAFFGRCGFTDEELDCEVWQWPPIQAS